MYVYMYILNKKTHLIKQNTTHTYIYILNKYMYIYIYVYIYICIYIHTNALLLAIHKRLFLADVLL